MNLPTSRVLFKQKCLRALGYPTLQIEADDEQIEDRIDDALIMFWEWHYDGLERTYFKYQLTSTDITNQYITVPDEIIGVSKVLEMGSSQASSLFSIKYQMALNDFWDLSASRSLIYYWTARTHLELIADFFSQQPSLLYNKRVNKLYLQMNWSSVRSGDWIVAEAYKHVDPESYPKVWQDPWLFKYAVALIKKQVATHLKKFNMQLPGGVTFNGQDMYNEASQDIKDLEQEMIDSSLPPLDIIG